MSEEADKKFRRRVEKTCDDILTQLDQLRDRVLAMRRGAAGENPVGDVLALWNELWVNLYAIGQAGVHYDFTKADAGNVKRWLKTMDALTLKSRVTRYFLDRTPWLMHNRHPFNYFVTHFNTYAPASNQRPGELAQPSMPFEGCTEHEPRCTSDVEHTQKKQAELRA